MPGKFPNQPLISPACFGVLSEQLWQLGFRHHPELQEKWIKPVNGQLQNFTTWDLVDVMPKAAEMIVEEFPEVAKTLSKVTPENHKQMVQEQTASLIEKLSLLQQQIEGMHGKEPASS